MNERGSIEAVAIEFPEKCLNDGQILPVDLRVA